MRIISIVLILSRLPSDDPSDGLRPPEARPRAFLLENGGGDWGKALGQDLSGTAEGYNPEATIKS